MMDDAIRLIFGANTDHDTFDNVFAGLIGYVIAVNGVDLFLDDLFVAGKGPGLYGRAFDDESGFAIDGTERGFPWEFIESVEIY